MQYDKIARSYKAQSVQTASPGKLVLMFFDGYLRFTTAARCSFEETDFTKRNEGVNNNLIRAQNIVTELQSSLDMSVPGEPLAPFTGYTTMSCISYNNPICRKKKNQLMKRIK